MVVKKVASLLDLVPAAFCIFPWKPPIYAEIWWHEKTHSFAFHKWTCWQWKCCEQIPLKRSFQLQQPEWGDALSGYNWIIIEPFHQINNSWTTVEHLSISLYTTPPGQISPPVYCPKESQAVWGWLTRRPICGRLLWGDFCFLGPSPLVGISIWNIPDLFPYAPSNV